MITMEEIKTDDQVMDCLDLDMTPEKAVALYLEWGSSWAHGRDFVRSNSDMSCYFTIDAWETPARVFLVQLSMGGGETVDEVEAPRELVDRELQDWGGRKGTYGIGENLKQWIRQQLS